MNNDDKKPYEQLRRELAEVAQKITTGAQYAHYKHPDKPYKVVGFVIWEEHDDVAVMYQPLHEEGVVFARPASVWLETVEWEGEMIPRFKKVA